MTKIISPIENCPIHLSGFCGIDFVGKLRYVPPPNADPDYALYSSSESYKMCVDNYWKEYGYEPDMG